MSSSPRSSRATTVPAADRRPARPATAVPTMVPATGGPKDAGLKAAPMKALGAIVVPKDAGPMHVTATVGPKDAAMAAIWSRAVTAAMAIRAATEIAGRPGATATLAAPGPFRLLPIEDVICRVLEGRCADPWPARRPMAACLRRWTGEFETWSGNWTRSCVSSRS
jgi:hypothetical protein